MPIYRENGIGVGPTLKDVGDAVGTRGNRGDHLDGPGGIGWPQGKFTTREVEAWGVFDSLEELDCVACRLGVSALGLR